VAEQILLQMKAKRLSAAARGGDTDRGSLLELWDPDRELLCGDIRSPELMKRGGDLSEKHNSPETGCCYQKQ
jgi:hypothetical protein